MLGRGQQASKKGMRKRTFTSPQAKHALSRFELAGHTSIGVLCGSSFIIVNVCVCVFGEGGGVLCLSCVVGGSCLCVWLTDSDLKPSWEDL